MIITQTPLRVSLLGGNTDFPEYYKRYGGLVLTSTIDKYIYCIVKERFDDLIYIDYSQKEIVEKVDDIKHDLVREAMRLVGVNKGIEISFLSDIPSSGSGLGSSSAVTVGVLNALHAYKGEYVSSTQLAEEAVRIELDVLKKPIGVQDQYAVALGGIRWINFDKDNVGGSRIEVKDIEDFNNSLMLLYTGVTRKSENVLHKFNVSENRDDLTEVKKLAVLGGLALKKGDLKSFGDNLDTYWNLKKKMNISVTNEEISDMYSRARHSGAIGGKVIGAGGGGFLLVMFPANKRAKIQEVLKDYKELKFRFSNGGSRIILNI